MANTYNLDAAKWWYGITFSATAVVYPFLTIYFKECGFNDRQVGILFAVRPWLTAIMGNMWAGLADHLQIHRPLFLVCYVCSSLFRFSICLTANFLVALAICVLTELFAPPVMILMDASTMAATAKLRGGYGRVRMWGAIGWGGMSPLGGWLVTHYGMRDGFYGYLLLVIVGFIPAVLAPIQVLTHNCEQAKQARHSRRQAAAQAGDGGISAAACQVTTAPAELVKGSAPLLPGTSYHGSLDENGAVAHRSGSAYESADESQPDYLTAEETASDEPGSAGSDLDLGGIRSSLDTHIQVRSSSLAPADRARKAAGILGVPEYSAAAQMRSPPGLASLRQHVPGTRPSGHAGAGELAGLLPMQDVDPHLALTWAALEQLPLTCEPVLQAYNLHTLQSNRGQAPPAPQPLAPEQDSRQLHQQHQVCEPAVLFADHSAAEDMTAVQRVLAVISRGEVAIFLVMAVCFGYGMGTIDSFMFIYLKELGGSEFLMGLCIATMCAAEAPLFHFAAPIFDFLGLQLVLNIVMFVYILRLCLYGFLPLTGTPWAVLPIEVLHGVTFGCAWAAGTLYCSRIAPKGLEATTQALFNGLYVGVGLGLGAVVGGILYEAFGGRFVFFAAAATIAGGWLLVGLVQLLLRCWHPPRKEKPAENGLQQALLQA